MNARLGRIRMGERNPPRTEGRNRQLADEQVVRIDRELKSIRLSEPEVLDNALPDGNQQRIRRIRGRRPVIILIDGEWRERRHRE